MKAKTLLIGALVFVTAGAVGTQLIEQPQTVEKTEALDKGEVIKRELAGLSNEDVDVNPEDVKESEQKTEEETVKEVAPEAKQAPETQKENTTQNDETTAKEEESTVSEKPAPKPEVEDVKPEVTPEVAPEVAPEVTTPAPKPEAPKPDVSETQDQFLAAVEQRIYALVNVERENAGLFELSYNNTMQKYARIKSKDMGDNGYFDHRDLSGELITTMMEADGVTYQAWGENIAYIGGGDVNGIADQFMTNWMNSEGHRANILSNNFDSIGVGVYMIGNKVYATQEFHR